MCVRERERGGGEKDAGRQTKKDRKKGRMCNTA